MNAKELRVCALSLQAYDKSFVGQTLANHVLATVRDDDGEQCNAGWLSEQTQYDIETHDDGWVFVQVDERIGMFGNCADAESWQVWCEEHFIGECVTRGQFRSLCRGLGIELKEGGK